MNDYALSLLGDYGLLYGKVFFLDNELDPSQFGSDGYSIFAIFTRESDGLEYGGVSIVNCAIDNKNNLWAKVDIELENVFVVIDTSNQNAYTYRMHKSRGLVDDLTMYTQIQGCFSNLSQTQLSPISEGPIIMDVIVRGLCSQDYGKHCVELQKAPEGAEFFAVGKCEKLKVGFMVFFENGTVLFVAEEYIVLETETILVNGTFNEIYNRVIAFEGNKVGSIHQIFSEGESFFKNEEIHNFTVPIFRTVNENNKSSRAVIKYVGEKSIVLTEIEAAVALLTAVVRHKVSAILSMTVFYNNNERIEAYSAHRDPDSEDEICFEQVTDDLGFCIEEPNILNGYIFCKAYRR